MTCRCECLSHNGFLTAKGLKEAEQRELELAGFRGVDKSMAPWYLDKVGSVSALVEVEGDHVFDDQLLEDQYRRFHNGS